MAIHFHLDYTTPFGIGDDVFVRHPPNTIPNTGGPAWPAYRQGTVSQVKLILEESTEKALCVTHPTAQKSLQIAKVIYTIIAHPSASHQSAFMVECPTSIDSEPMVFGKEEEIQTYLQQRQS